MSNNERSHYTSIRLSPEAKALRAKLAYKKGVSLSDVVEIAIREMAEREGLTENSIPTKRTEYIDKYGGQLFYDPWMHRSMFAIGQSVINQNRAYIVDDCKLSEDGNVMIVEVHECNT